MIVLCILRTGGDYGPRHVAKLRDGVKRHSPNAEFVCMTDVPEAVEADTVVKLEHPEWPRWWAKIHAFHPMWYFRDVLYVDLDSLVVAPLEPLAAERFTMLKAFGGPGFGSGVMFSPRQHGRHIYDTFEADPLGFMRKHAEANGFPWGDQAFIASVDDPDTYGPEAGIYSYKRHCQNGIPEDARIICWSGLPRCHETRLWWNGRASSDDGIWQCNGWHIPVSETHLVGFLREAGGYQKSHRQAALQHVKSFRRAVDVGAHIGLWSRDFAKVFAKVEAFEPIALHRRCFLRNVPMRNVTLHECALAETEGEVRIAWADDHTMTAHVAEDGEPAQARTLDSFAFDDVDYIKLDCEGYEMFALKGAEQTLLRCKPVVSIECKAHGERYGVERYAPVEYLESLGMVQARRVVDDIIMVWG